MLIDQVPTANVLVLLTYRLEFKPPWSPRAHLTQISTNRLTRKQSGRMIKWLAKNKDLPVAIFTEILNKTDGIPFFVEELTKMVLESNLLKETHDHYELNAPLSSLAIPTTLQDSLMAKLDRLGPEKELAQLSATLGREFPHSLLQAVAPNSVNQLDQRLSNLVCHELLYQRGLPPHASYTFRHALVHEVAYQSLLKKTRQKYHRKIAEALISQFPASVEENPEIVAHHCTEAGDYQKAIGYWLQAGRHAIQLSANSDAIAHLSNGLLALEHLPDTQEKSEHELTFQATLGLAYMLSKGYAAPEVLKAYARAFALSRSVGEATTTFPILCGLWEFYMVRADIATAHDLAQQLDNIAKQSPNRAFTLEAQRALGATDLWRGEFTSAFEHLQKKLKTNDHNSAARNSPNMDSYSQDTEVANLSNMACIFWLLGHPDQALANVEQAHKLAQNISHPFSLAYALHFTTIIQQLRGNAQDTLKYAENVLELSRQYNFTFWQAPGEMMRSWALMQFEPKNHHIVVFVAALNHYRTSGSRLALTYFQALLTEMYLSIGNADAAQQVVDTLFEDIAMYGERVFEAEVYRLQGNIHRYKNTGPAQEAEKYLVKALELARTHKAVFLQLRIATNLSQLWQVEGKYVQAKSILMELLSTFKEGFTTRDWQVADALAGELISQIENQERAKSG